MMTGGIVLVLLLVPGMPKFQMLLLGGGLIAAGYFLNRKTKEAAQQEAAAVAGAVVEEQKKTADEGEYFKDINNVYSMIGVDPIEMEFGYSLIPLVDESSGGKMINHIVIFRRQYAQEMGVVIPSISLRDSSSLNTNQYADQDQGEEVAGKSWWITILRWSRPETDRRG